MPLPMKHFLSSRKIEKFRKIAEYIPDSLAVDLYVKQWTVCMRL